MVISNDLQKDNGEYDGMWVIAFLPNQIKLTSNTNPTTDNDIRFSLDSDGNKLTSEQSEFPL